MNAATFAPRLYAMELSNIACGDWCLRAGGRKRRRMTVEVGYREQLREAVAKPKEKLPANLTKPK